MPKRKPDQLPKILQNKKGEFFCNFERRKIYLGRNQQSAKQKLLEFLLKEQESPTDAAYGTDRDRATEAEEKKSKNFSENFLPKENPENQQSEQTIIELLADFMEEMKNHSHFDKIRSMARVLAAKFGETKVDRFGPQALIACRNEWIQQGLSRAYINKLTGWVLRLFQWGVTKETVQLQTFQRIQLVEPLKTGEAKEPEPRTDVPDAEIIKTLPHLLPTIRDMVVLQRISGMRPSELFRMTLEQFVKREPEAWVYVPFKHKTKAHNKTRAVGFGRFEISILERHARGKKPDEPLFSPQDCWFERAERLGRGTPKPNPLIGKFFRKDGYLHNITKTIERVNEQKRREGRPAEEMIQHWTPYQLRHAAATFLSILMTERDAATALGHASTQTTRIYDHSAVEKTILFIRERDQTCGEKLQGLVKNLENLEY